MEDKAKHIVNALISFPLIILAMTSEQYGLAAAQFGFWILISLVIYFGVVR
jgi:uncharacterized membrane protein